MSTVLFTTKYIIANYYPFGMQHTGTAGSYNLSSDYRYGYGGANNEVRGINSDESGYYQKSKKK